MIARTTSTPTCRKAIRSASCIEFHRWSTGGYVDIEPEVRRRPDDHRGCNERLHVEQDAGKLAARRSTRPRPMVDLNRSGTGVDGDRQRSRTCARPPRKPRPTCAKLRSGAALSSAPATATWTKVRCAADINVSVRKPGEALGTRTRGEERQLDPLRRRQCDRVRGGAARWRLIEGGGTVEQETRLYRPRPRRDPLHALKRGCP